VLLAVVIALLAATGVFVSAHVDQPKPQYAVRSGPQPGLLSHRAPAVDDDFSRATSGDLGRAPTGQRWVSIAGLWSAHLGSADVRPTVGRLQLATLDAGFSNGTVEASFGKVAQGAGAAFRCRDAQNCWWIEAVPAYATWAIERTVNGRRLGVAHLPAVGAGSGSTIDVRMHGSRIEVFLNGILRRTIDDPALQHEHGSGLVVDGGHAGATWTSFRAAPEER
jgi:hypothetical protein